MIQHYCDKCSKPLRPDEVYQMRITCRKVMRVGVSKDLEYCEDCMKGIIPTEVREEEARLKAELAERVKARKEARVLAANKGEL